MDQNSKLIEVPDFNQFETLFYKNHEFLCLVAIQLVKDDFVAEDLVQEFFIKYWEGREHIQVKTTFEAFAYRSVKNSCIDYLRRQAVAEKRFADIPLESEVEEEEDIPLHDRRLKRILELLEELPAERRKVFELHAVDGLTYQQIADRLGISINTVKTQLRRAYGTLRGKAITVLVLGYLMRYLH